MSKNIKNKINFQLFPLLFLFFSISFLQNSFAKINPASNNNDQELGEISSLMNAIIDGDIEGVKFFVKTDANGVNQKNIGGATALHLAARTGNVEIAQLLIKNGANINAVDNEKWTPLMRAATAKNDQLMAILLEKGADARKFNSIGETVIIITATSNCFECLNILLNKFDYSTMDVKDLKSQLSEAFIIAKNDEVMQYLLSIYLNKIDRLNMSAATKKPVVAYDISKIKTNKNIEGKDNDINLFTSKDLAITTLPIDQKDIKQKDKKIFKLQKGEDAKIENIKEQKIEHKTIIPNEENKKFKFLGNKLSDINESEQEQQSRKPIFKRFLLFIFPDKWFEENNKSENEENKKFKFLGDEANGDSKIHNNNNKTEEIDDSEIDAIISEAEKNVSSSNQIIQDEEKTEEVIIDLNSNNKNSASKNKSKNSKKFKLKSPK